MFRKIVIFSACLTLFSGCTRDRGVPRPQDVDYSVEYYDYSTRKHKPQQVRSRVMWSHLPQPLPSEVETESPLIWPKMSFELPDSTLGEAIEAVCSAIGYRGHYSKRIANRPISVNKIATVDEILKELGKQARVVAELDHKNRTLRVFGPNQVPTL